MCNSRAGPGRKDPQLPFKSKEFGHDPEDHRGTLKELLTLMIDLKQGIDIVSTSKRLFDGLEKMG